MKINYEHPATGTVGWFQECIQILEGRVNALESEVFGPEAPALEDPAPEAPE